MSDGNGVNKRDTGAERTSLVFSFVHVPNKQVLSTLEKPTAAEVLLCRARVVINVLLRRKRYAGKMNTAVAHPKVCDHVDKARVVMLFAITGMIGPYNEGIS